jgi:hypothetical protein
MKTLLLSATLIGAGLVIAGAVVAQNINKGSDPNATTGLSSANKEHNEMGASSAGSDTGSATTKSAVSHNDPTTKGRTSGKERNEAPAPNR